MYESVLVHDGDIGNLRKILPRMQRHFINLINDHAVHGKKHFRTLTILYYKTI